VCYTVAESFPQIGGSRITSGDGVTVNFKVELEQEEDGRWIAEVPDLPGVLAYGASQDEARAKAQALALRVLADRLEHGEASAQLLSISFTAA
jgi:predicted RNase H-like HicB family nuclease